MHTIDFTSRQRTLCEYLIHGDSVPEIAKKRKVKETTINKEINTIKKELGLVTDLPGLRAVLRRRFQ